MTRSLRASLALLVFLGLAGATSEAGAQFRPLVRFRGAVGVRTPVVVPQARSAQVVVTVGPPPPPVVYVRPAPPPPPRVVYVQPQPQPQVVYVQPQPQPQPQVVYVQQQQPGVSVQRRNVRGTAGLHFYVAGAGGEAARMGGVGGAVRIRPKEHFAVDLGMGVFGGSDYYGRDRVEIPIGADFLGFVNPQHRAQFYVVGGLAASFAYGDTRTSGVWERTYTYVGAQAGAGIEFRITRGFALNADLRGFIRRQPSGTPEFTSASGEQTRVSGGYVGQLGTTFYF